MDRIARAPDPRGTFLIPRRCPHCAVLVASLAEYRAHFKAVHYGRKP
jgi:hypothetical protein